MYERASRHDLVRFRRQSANVRRMEAPVDSAVYQSELREDP